MLQLIKKKTGLFSEIIYDLYRNLVCLEMLCCSVKKKKSSWEDLDKNFKFHRGTNHLCISMLLTQSTVVPSFPISEWH